MNNFKTCFPVKLATLMLFFAGIIFSGCSNKVNFNTSQVVPAAVGYAKVTKGDNGNKLIKIEITHLSPPERLRPSKDMYIVWMETEDNGTRNIGQLRTETGFFSSTFKSSFTAITPFKPKKFFITAENSANIIKPNGETVLSTNKL